MIIVDIDGTVLDVTERMKASLRDAGVKPGENPSRTVEGLRGKLKNDFFARFQSEAHTHLDTPIPEVIEELRQLLQVAELPIVYLSGRLASMKKSTQKAIDTIDLPYEAIVLRPWNQRMRRTTDLKIALTKERGYEPVHVFDDDASILAAFAAAFPGVTLHQVGVSRESTPVS